MAVEIAEVEEDEAEPMVVGSRAGGRGESEEVIGAPPPPMRVVPGPSAPPPARKPPVASRAYAVDRAGKPMPRVYGGHRWLKLWYVPVAALVAVGVALGVVWVAGLFDGDDGDAAAGEDPTATATVAASGTPGGETATPTGAAPTGGKFEINDAVVITGLGSGGTGEAPCLNVRTEPGVDKPAVDCLREGTQLVILGGPEEAGGLTWWFVKTPSGDLWAAEDYLTEP
jgi:hypothetical protein